jgi:hypothetical protein
MWKCNKCKREFQKENQSHSCVVYPIENHFKNRDKEIVDLFYSLIKSIEKNVGSVKIESLPCCIHLLSSYTFSGVWILKDGVRFDFRLDRDIQSSRFTRKLQMSKNRFLYYLEIQKEEDIDKELIKWIGEAYKLEK